MYRHLLVPTDGSEVSARAIEQAVRFAKSVSAKVTFLIARPDYAATSAGALAIAIEPKSYAYHAAGPAASVLAKAEVQARRAGIPFSSMVRTSDRPHELILEVAEEEGCDLIFMASHGRRGIRSLMIGSQTQKVLSHSTIPVLVSAVDSNLTTSAMCSALSNLRDEHLSLAAVVHALQEINAAVRLGEHVDFPILKGLINYIEKFPGTIHHPKEERHLFAHIQARTNYADETIAKLKGQHVAEKLLLDTLNNDLVAWESGATADAFSVSLDRLAAAIYEHMGIEEDWLIPLATKCLHESDWEDIAKAFSDNRDPMSGLELESEFKDLFAKAINLAK